MVLARFAWLLLLLPLLALTGCDGGTLCGRVRCEGGRVCDPKTGACVAEVSDGGAKSDAGAVCTPACTTGVCNPANHRCVSCLSDSNCGCPNPTCNLSSHSCVAPTSTSFPAQQPGESCAEATSMAFPACQKATQFQVDLGARIDDENGTCTTPANLGRDAVFLIDLDGGYDIRVTASAATGSSAQPVVYLRDTPCETGAELVCSNAIGTNTLRASFLAPGQYALVVDSYDVSGSGLVDVRVELITRPPNDSCTTSLVAPTDGGSFTVELSTFSNDVVATCGRSSSPDALWQVVLDKDSDFHAVVTGNDPDAGTDPVLSLRRSPCADAGEVTCIDQSYSGSENLRVRNLAAGTYFLMVENWSDNGAGAMTVTTWATDPVAPPSNDTCAAPRLITFPSGSNTTTFTVDTSLGDDDAQSSCSSDSSYGGRELIYQLSLATTQTLTATAQRLDGGSVDPVLYLRRGACSLDGGTEVACSDAPEADALETVSETLPAGNYFLFVDSYDAPSAGPTVVTVTLEP